MFCTSSPKRFKFDDSPCIICNNISSPAENRLEVQVKLTTVFLEYFFSQSEREEVTIKQLRLFAYCEKCVNILNELIEFHEHLGILQNNIKSVVTKVKCLILQNRKEEEEDINISKFRKIATKDFCPGVLLNKFNGNSKRKSPDGKRRVGDDHKPSEVQKDETNCDPVIGQSEIQHQILPVSPEKRRKSLKSIENSSEIALTPPCPLIDSETDSLCIEETSENNEQALDEQLISTSHALPKSNSSKDTKETEIQTVIIKAEPEIQIRPEEIMINNPELNFNFVEEVTMKYEPWSQSPIDQEEIEDIFANSEAAQQGHMDVQSIALNSSSYEHGNRINQGAPSIKRLDTINNEQPEKILSLPLIQFSNSGHAPVKSSSWMETGLKPRSFQEPASQYKRNSRSLSVQPLPMHNANNEGQTRLNNFSQVNPGTSWSQSQGAPGLESNSEQLTRNSNPVTSWPQNGAQFTGKTTQGVAFRNTSCSQSQVRSQSQVTHNVYSERNPNTASPQGRFLQDNTKVTEVSGNNSQRVTYLHPPFTFTQMIYIAISNLTSQGAPSTTDTIWTYIINTFPFYKLHDHMKKLAVQMLMESDLFDQVNIRNTSATSPMVAWTVKRTEVNDFIHKINDQLSVFHNPPSAYMISPDINLTTALGQSYNATAKIPQTQHHNIDSSNVRKEKEVIVLQENTNASPTSLIQEEVIQKAPTYSIAYGPTSSSNWPSVNARKYWEKPPFSRTVVAAIITASADTIGLTCPAICEQMWSCFPHFLEIKNDLAKRLYPSLSTSYFFVKIFDGGLPFSIFYLNTANEKAMESLKNEFRNAIEMQPSFIRNCMTNPENLLSMAQKILGPDYQFKDTTSKTKWYQLQQR